ncbi:WhiB family transcriptional regulator [Streptomyces griseoviridis]|uniref:WhiB family transcriptional regulator n=1 Tax=Streptomyces griseoviridis TaxID=45398 RepID=UPI00344FE90B
MNREWELRAACRDMDPGVFFKASTIGLARQTCGGCEVRMECLESALVREAGLPPSARTGLVAGLYGRERWAIDQQRAKAAGDEPQRRRRRSVR